MASFLKENIFVFDTKNQLDDFAITLWEKIGNAAIDQKGFFAVALSGGKTPTTFYQSLAKKLKNFYWEKTYLFLVDERFVPFNHPDNNFQMIRKNLLQTLPVKNEQIFSIPTEQVTLLEAAKQYEKYIKDFFHLRTKEIPNFDLITLGIGTNGHTASLFPNHAVLQEKHRLVMPVVGNHTLHDRVTLTLPLINQAKNIIFMMHGKSKASIAKHVIVDQDVSLPASLVHPENTYFLLDKKAATNIKR